MAAPTADPVTPQQVSIATPPQPLPPLESGDRLTREEFERRYDAMPELKKAELIEGVVYVASPVRITHHGEPHTDLITWLGIYRTYTPGVRAGDNTTIRLDLDNEPQPDAFLMLERALGGQALIDDDGYVAGAPELAAEVAASSAGLDLHDKLRVYRRNGVREYVVWRVLDRVVDWFVLRQSRYDNLARSAVGFYQSEVFPGLWLDADALVGGDLPRVHQVLQQGLASPEHAAFVAELSQRAGRTL